MAVCLCPFAEHDISIYFCSFAFSCTTELILSSDKISSLLLQSCHAYFAVVINFISAEVILDLPFSLIARVSHPYNKVGNAKVLHVFSVVCFWS